MFRTQIQLSEEQAEALKALARERGVSLASLVREAADRLIEDAPKAQRFRRALEIAGKYSSGLGDVASEHDSYLDEAWGN